MLIVTTKAKGVLIACQKARADPLILNTLLQVLKTDSKRSNITIFWSSKNQYYRSLGLFGIIFAAIRLKQNIHISQLTGS